MMPGKKQRGGAATSATRGGKHRPCAVVGIGASAGGLAAFKAFFSSMPSDSGVAFVLVPHLDPTHESLMVELLARQTDMPVCEAGDDMEIEPDHVYIIPPGNYLAIRDTRLQLLEPDKPRGTQIAIDHFLRALAEDQQQRSVAVILSGTGNHGSLGLKEVKAAGGMVMAQEPASAEHEQMPRSAIATGLVDYVLPPESMPEALVRYVRQPYIVQAQEEKKAAPPSEAIEQLDDILGVLRTHTKSDFRCYRKNMLNRRVLRRMSLCHIDTYAAYTDHLRENAGEITALYKDLLIGVTAFFREPEAFKVLAKSVIPELVERSGIDNPLRVWVPACSTGEEAYSIAILFFEQFRVTGKPVNLQVFATDIDKEALEVARRGIYPDSIAADVSPELIKHYFFAAGENHCQVNKQLRDAIVFAPQSLINDAPFSNLDLVSCRNLLIYLEPAMQHKVISLLHFTLKEGGYLLLGPSESIGAAVDMFEAVSKKWRVFRRIGPARRNLVEIPIIASAGLQWTRIPRVEPARRMGAVYAEVMQKALLKELAPAAVLINRKYEALGFQGPTGNYLEFPSGEPTHDLMSLAREGLRTKLRAACHKAIHDGVPVTVADARVKRNGGYTPCSISVRPLSEPKEAESLLLVSFVDHTPSTPAGASKTELIEAGSDGENQFVKQLEHELKDTREDLQSTIEELENSNEELKASNEEIMSMNEELQSANEELETSKEELQSLNEELSTMNQQLQEKVEALDVANNDMFNLLASTDIGTVFLDKDFRVQHFTPAIGKLLSLVATDVGRPITDFSAKFHDADLLPDCARVLKDLTRIEKEVWALENNVTAPVSRDATPPPGASWYIRRISPYRTREDHIKGVVITFVDITRRKGAEEQLEERVAQRTKELHISEHRLRAIMESAAEAIVVIGLDGLVTEFNPAAEEIFGYSSDEVAGHNVTLLMPAPYNEEHDSYLARYQKSGKGWLMDKWRELPGRHKDGSIIPLEIIVREIDHIGAYCGIIRDLSEQRALEREIAEISTLEQERIGQDIHDGLGQQLTGLTMIAASLKSDLAKRNMPEAKNMDLMIGQLHEAVGEVRALSRGLAPIPITPQGLEDALRKLAKDTEASTGINCHFEAQQTVDIEDRTVAMQLYRITQEALNNAVKHAKATDITIMLGPGHCDLAISDNGNGFQVGEAIASGFGLRIMRYRAGTIGCSLGIDSTPGKGAVVRCESMATVRKRS
jgi:two-component system CheB/CheR fusion protein